MILWRDIFPEFVGFGDICEISKHGFAKIRINLENGSNQNCSNENVKTNAATFGIHQGWGGICLKQERKPVRFWHFYT